MKLILADGNGEVLDSFEDIEQYDLSESMARSVVMDELERIVRKAKRRAAR